MAMRLAKAAGFLLWGAALFAGLGLGGCSDTQMTTNGDLVSDVNSPVADVPIPAGYQMTNESRSTVTPGASTRFVDHYYKGDGGFMPAVRFFRDQLPQKGWTLITQQQTGDQVIMNYTKGAEDIMLTIYEGTFDTHVNVRIYPAARAAAAGK